jgi:hydroxymethylglutaryl-CoA reductase (NADPH)
MTSAIQIPVKKIGPVHIMGDFEDRVMVPLATYERPLWPSVARGARLSRKTDGISVHLVDERMTRSAIFEADNAQQLINLKAYLIQNKSQLQQEVGKTSRFAQLININFEIVGNLIYIRFEYLTGDAAGHNMTTKATERLIDWITQHNHKIQYVSISGNYCTDKKVSAVNGILGRGKNVVAEINIPAGLCKKHLRATPSEIVEINNKKNLIGSILAGSLRSANAHYANMLLAFYLATGQDAANIVEGSQGITHASVDHNRSLYFSVTCPNIILGTVGNGKDYDFARRYLNDMGCLDDDSKPGQGARKLACVAAATVLCGELSLLAAQTNEGELMRAHETIERKQTNPDHESR